MALPAFLLSPLIKWGLVALVFAGVAAGAHAVVTAYNGAIADKARAEAESKTLRGALRDSQAGVAKLQEMGRLSDELATNAKKETERERRKAKEFEDKLNAAANAAAVAGDPTARDWLAAPVPPLIRGMRRAERADGGSPGPGLRHPDRPAGANPGAAPARRNQRGAALGN